MFKKNSKEIGPKFETLGQTKAPEPKGQQLSNAEIKQDRLAITINLNPESSCYSNSKERHVEYQDLLPTEQYEVLCDVLSDAMAMISYKCHQDGYYKTVKDMDGKNEFIFEHCNDGRLHTHGYIYMPATRCNRTTHAYIQTLIWNSIGHFIKKHNKKQYMIEVSNIKDDGWDEYMKKDQHNIDKCLKSFKYHYYTKIEQMYDFYFEARDKGEKINKPYYKHDNLIEE